MKWWGGTRTECKEGKFWVVREPPRVVNGGFFFGRVQIFMEMLCHQLMSTPRAEFILKRI
jgi:hypothetical protein